tara:strand:+ start:162 stop:596 length:435 start_codon:yes stop_codon:yes gene_type:complete
LIEYVKNNNVVLAIIIRESFSKNGIEFFTPDDYSQQVGYMKRPKGYIIKPHIHYSIPRTISTLQEVLFIKKGKVRVDFYDDYKNYIVSELLFNGDFIILISSGHGFVMLDESEIIEVKQGPYLEKRDKEKFNPISNDKIIMKKN